MTLTRALEVKSNVAIRLPIYDSLSMFNSNIGPTQAPLRDIRLRNLSDLDFDLSRSNGLMVQLDSPYMSSS